MEYPRQVDGPLRNAQVHQKVAQFAHNCACTKRAKLILRAYVYSFSNKLFSKMVTVNKMVAAGVVDHALRVSIYRETKSMCRFR